MKRVIILTLLFYSLVYSAEKDSLLNAELLMLKSRLDSLRQSMERMGRELGGRGRGNGRRYGNNRQEQAPCSERERLFRDLRRCRRARVNDLLMEMAERPGHLKLNGGATAVVQYGDDSEEDYTVSTGSFDIYGSANLGSKAMFFVDLEAGGGEGMDALFHSFSGLNGDAAPSRDFEGNDRLTVLEAWAEFDLLNNHLVVTAGKVDLTNYFDINAYANDETMQFINGSFINGSAFIVPENGTGLRLRTSFRGKLHFQLGFAKTGLSRHQLFKDLYKVACLGVSLLENERFQSTLRLFGYDHPSVKNGTGWGLSFDGTFQKYFGIFARYGKNEKDLAVAFDMEEAWSVGIYASRLVKKRMIAFGAAFGNNQSWRKSSNNEKAVELFCRVQVNEWIYVSPHCQFITNGDYVSSEDFFLLGIRTHMNF